MMKINFRDKARESLLRAQNEINSQDILLPILISGDNMSGF